LINYTPKAAQQVADLRQHYEDRQRLDALLAPGAAMNEAEQKIENNTAGLAAPRSYPTLTQPGRAWIKAGRYWVTYSTGASPVIVGVFYETANFPRRI
jgi:hypothetical protein